jgi:hypothetical protein
VLSPSENGCECGAGVSPRAPFERCPSRAELSCDRCNRYGRTIALLTGPGYGAWRRTVGCTPSPVDRGSGHVAGSGPSTLNTVAPAPPTRTMTPAPPSGGDRLAVHQVRRDVDEVTLADLDQLATARPELDRHPAAGDIAVGGIVPVVMPAGRGATREGDEAGPDPIMGEGLAALDVGGLLGRWVLKRLPRDDLGGGPWSPPVSTGAHRSVRLPAWPHNPKTRHDRVTAAPAPGSLAARPASPAVAARPRRPPARRRSDIDLVQHHVRGWHRIGCTPRSGSMTAWPPSCSLARRPFSSSRRNRAAPDR